MDLTRRLYFNPSVDSCFSLRSISPSKTMEPCPSCIGFSNSCERSSSGTASPSAEENRRTVKVTMPGLKLVAVNNDAITGHRKNSQLLDHKAKRTQVVCHFRDISPHFGFWGIATHTRQSGRFPNTKEPTRQPCCDHISTQPLTRV